MTHAQFYRRLLDAQQSADSAFLSESERRQYERLDEVVITMARQGRHSLSLSRLSSQGFAPPVVQRYADYRQLSIEGESDASLSLLPSEDPLSGL